MTKIPVPIFHEADAVPIAPNATTLNGIAVAVLLIIFAIVGAVWAVDDHFISRREFNEKMNMVTEQLKAIEEFERFGTHRPAQPEPEP